MVRISDAEGPSHEPPLLGCRPRDQGEPAEATTYHAGVATDAVDLGQVHRLSLDEYHQLVESGGLDEDTRVELIDGLLLDMSPKTREHENAIAYLAEWLSRTVDRTRYQVRVASALTLQRSEPEPDVIVIPREAPRPYHPGTATLVIEVSVSSLRRDLVRKPSLYAAAGVDEYWVIDLERRRAVVYRDPRGDGYTDVTELHVEGELVPASLDIEPLALEGLLHAAEA